MRAHISIFLSTAVFLCAAGEMATATVLLEPKNVLVLYSERGDLPAIQVTEQNIRDVFHGSNSPRINLFSEYCDFARFPPAQSSETVASYLKHRYSEKKLDLVLPVGGFALEFALEHRARLFPAVPIVFCASEKREIDRLDIPADVIGIVGHFDIERTIHLILQFQPGVTEIACVSGTSEFDRRWAEEGSLVLQRFPKLKARWISNATIDTTLAEVAGVSPDAAVLFFSYLRDGAGISTKSADVLAKLAAKSPAPVYGLASHFIPTGIVGGAMFDFGTNGRQTAELALRILRGETSTQSGENRNPLIVNWPGLKRWNLPETSVPTDAAIVGRTPGIWETHGTQIIIGLSIGILQSLLITGLFIQRIGKRQAEASLRESEKRLNLAAEAGNLGMWVWNMSRDEIWMSDKCRRLYALAPEVTLSIEGFLRLLYPEDQARTRHAIEQAITLGADYDIEYCTKTDEGAPRWISSHGKVDHQANRMLGVSVDITSRREAMLDLELHRDELAHLSRVALMGEMASSLAHELNQPLTGIIANANAGQRYLQKEAIEKEEIGGLLQDIADDGQRAADVIRGIRDMVKKGKFQAEELQVNTIIKQVTKIMHAHAISRNCELILELANPLPSIRGNAPQLQQVLINLILNGFDAMQETPAGRRRLILSTKAIGNSDIEICARDFGCGLPEDGKRIFEKFFTTKRDGLGMGLVIARSIVEAHGGRLTATNAKDGGANVCAILPAAAI